MSEGHGLLTGKKGIIFGALDERSIAWRVALACHREGAEFALSNAPIALRLGTLDALSEETGAPIIPCDVSDDDAVKEMMEKVRAEIGGVDFILHAIGMSPNIRKKKEYTDINYRWFQQSLDISAISLHRVLHFADKAGILNDGGSVIALSYIGAQRIFSKYSDMNDAKALLESIARNYGSRLAPRGIRVNTISQAPTKTSAGSGIRGFDGMYTFAEKLAPMGNPSADDCADYCVAMFSDLTRKVTMQNLFHDGGFVTNGISEEMMEDLAKIYADEEIKLMPDIILGIDPGSRVTGYAVLTEEHGKLIALRCDVIRMAKIENHADRLNYIFEKVSDIIKSIQPTQCAVETPIYGVDPQAMLKLGRAQAAAILAIKQCGLEAVEYFPKVVKKSITGNGNASKEQVAFMLKKMVKLPDEKLSNDATDALAVAWCHMMSNRGIPSGQKKTHQNNKKGDWASFVEQNPERIRKL